MSKALKHKDFLSLLGKSKNTKRRRQLITLAAPEEIAAIQECVTNVLKGNLKISKKNQRKLLKYKNTLRKLASKSGSKASKKKLLTGQQGGFLPMLLPLAVSALSSIVPALLGK